MGNGTGNRKVPTEATVTARRNRADILTLDDIDGRTRACKQALELRAGFLADLGGADRVTVAQRELAQRASILGAMLEDQEARYLNGEPIPLAEYATLTNTQRRVLNDIGLQRVPRETQIDLKTYLAARSTEESGDE